VWFDSWSAVGRIVVVGTRGYLALIALLRVSGKRTLSKMNAFDFVITITLGSTYATLLISDTVPLVEGVVALALLVGLQWLVSAIYVRSEWFESLVKSGPQILYWRGDYLEDVLRRERITREEIQAAMRANDVSDHERAVAVLETQGDLTVMTIDETDSTHAMERVKGDSSIDGRGLGDS
jgi:uncharacterized membrane protein YcaP (DUF421 family)